MEQTPSSETDPPEIRRRLECIQGQRALIEDLATRLKAAQLEYDRLEKDLNAYRASIALIRKCPEEVLLMIFEAFSEHAPELLASLLHVCKRWRGVAINAPRLWTHIRIKVEPTWNQEKGAKRDQAHIAACLEHSASLPLHINVDLTEMSNKESQMSDFIEELLRGGCDNDICSWARRYVYKLDDDVDVHLGRLCDAYGSDNVLQTISKLVGHDGTHMSQWKSLRIFLPRSRQDVEAIWTLFCGPTPQLRELFISSEGFSQSYLEPSSEGTTSFPDLSSLEDLTLGFGEVTDLDFLPLTFPSVKRLDMETNIHTSLQLSRFTNLEYLDILFNEAPTNSSAALEVIHLPLLRDLTLHVYGSTKVEWHVPVLQRLWILGWIDDGLKALPTVRASHVCWTLDRQIMSYPTKIETSLLRTLEAIMSEYGDMQKLSIRTLLKPIWDKYVQGLDEEKRLALPAIDFN